MVKSRIVFILLLVCCATTASPPLRGAEGDESSPFWSFAPPQKTAPPEVTYSSWISNAIDPFVLKRLEDRGLHPHQPADRRTLIRRLTFDLIGLPPTPSEVDAFLQCDRPDAVAQLIERLLSSPRFGEKWARLWLDVARFAQDQAHIVGNDQSLCYPNAYLYRDWVIRAFNEDLPYDQFVRLQLAADLITPEQYEDWAALGFIGLGPKYYSRKRTEVMADEWEDRVDVVSRGLLGLTVACARCHDHKYDPIPTEDYYALAGVFASTEMFNRPLDESRETNDLGEAKQPQDALHIIRDSQPVDLNVFVRGDVNSKGPIVPRRFLEVLCGEQAVNLDRGSGRQQLAEAVASRDNPLTARVIVNRIWGQLFGKGLVRTPSNFGSLGSRPSHPKLLDDLAVRFMDSGWSLKWLIQEIVSSSTYQQSSSIQEEALATDPANLLLWRMDRRRLTAEAWRDAVLMVSGHLDEEIGGQSIDVQSPQATRRSIYAKVSRLQLDSYLAAFDFPDPNGHAARRVETTTPLQKLFVMNSPLIAHHAEQLSVRVKKHADADAARIEFAYRLLFGRSPTSVELDLGTAYIQQTASDEEDNWGQYAQVLLASNEFLVMD